MSTSSSAGFEAPRHHAPTSNVKLALVFAIGLLLGCLISRGPAPTDEAMLGRRLEALRGEEPLRSSPGESSEHAKEEGGGGDGEEEEGGHEGGEEEAEEEGEEVRFGGIFALEEVNAYIINGLLVGLIVVTICYEEGVVLLENHVFDSGIGALLMGKMVKELAILGFVSFTATVSMQFLKLEEEHREFFEYAHVLLFLSAVFYAVEISFISIQLDSIQEEFQDRDAHDEATLTAHEDQLWSQLEPWQHPIVDSSMGSFLNRQAQELKRRSTFKVLRFHFMSRNELLDREEAFNWAFYLTQCMNRSIESMIDVTWKAWVLVICSNCLCASIAFAVQDLPTRDVLVMFVGAGWLLFLADWLLFRISEGTIDWLIVKGHELRVAGEEHLRQQKLSSARAARHWHQMRGRLRNLTPLENASVGAEIEHDESKEQVLKAIRRASNVNLRQKISVVVDGSIRLLPAQACVRLIELKAASALRNDPVGIQHILDAFNALKAHPEAEDHVTPGLRIELMPVLLQLVLLLQSMYQALILTMLGRLAILEFGWLGGAVVIAAMWAPTSLMTALVTPHVLKDVAMTESVIEANHDVLDTMRQELQERGDYSAASQALEIMAQVQLSDNDLADAGVVRSHVRDLIKLGEMKWRYRVVDEGQSPREEAIKVLTHAKQLIEQHKATMLKAQAQQARTGGTSAEQLNRHLTNDWAEDLSGVLQGLGVTLLIYNTDRSEDKLIENYLTESLELRESKLLRKAMGETLNSLGMLKQKQKLYAEAEQVFRRSLETRRKMPEGEDKGKEKHKDIAQSLVSLGTLYIEMGDLKITNAPSIISRMSSYSGRSESARESARSPDGRNTDNGNYAKALEMYQEAKEAYIVGFGSQSNPKVAWALEGIGKVMQKMGDLRPAEEALSEAIAIRRSLHARDANKQFFNKELAAAEKHKEDIQELRKGSRSKLRSLAAKGSLNQTIERKMAGEGSGEIVSAVVMTAQKSCRTSNEDAAEKLPAQAPSVGSSDLRQPLLSEQSKPAKS